MLKIFSRSGVRKDKRYKDEITKQVAKVETDFTDHVRFLEKMVVEKYCKCLDGNKAAASVFKNSD